MQTMGRSVVLVEKLAALGVADDDVADVKLPEHGGGDFSGVGARGRFVHVLRAEADIRHGVEQFAHGGEGGEGRAKDDFSVVEPADFLDQVFDENARLGLGLVHLPVAGDDFFAGDHK